jgi:transposase
MPKHTFTMDNQRQLIIFHHYNKENKKTVREIAEMQNIPKSTVGDVITRFKNLDQLDLLNRGGRKKILTERNENWIVRQVKKNPKTSVPVLTAELQERFKIQVSTEAVQKSLRQNGFNGLVARKKPYINKKNRIKRLLFANELLFKDETFRNKVIFSLESNFNLFGSDQVRWTQNSLEKGQHSP